MNVSSKISELAGRFAAAAKGAQRAAKLPLLLDWGRHYLPEHFQRPSSPMHEWLESELAACSQSRGGRVNLIGPRGHAKSTLSTLAYVLKCAVEGAEPYIWIVSDTKEQAQLHLENVKRELIENGRLAEAYPLSVGKGRHWQRHAIELANGVVVEAWSTGQRIRGRRRREHRPTLIVCDDLQNDSHIASAAQREATRRWFHGTLMKAGTPRTNIVNLATALHRDALALELHAAAGWSSARFAAIQSWPTDLDLWNEWETIYCGGGGMQDAGCRERQFDGSSAAPSIPHPASSARTFFEAHREEMLAGSEVLWPEVEDLYTLMKMRVESGRTAFEREKQGSPVDPELCEWPESYFEDHIWFEAWPAELIVKTIALDPSKGREGRRGDYSAYVMLGIDPAGVIYVEADLARRATPQIVADGAAWCRRFWPHAFGVEANQFQELLAGEIAAEFERQQLGHVVPAAIHNHVNKQMRIRRLGPYLSQRRLRFLAGSASTRLLVDQLRDFPAGAHDDGPDALEMALRLAEEVWQGRNADDGLGKQMIFD
jgi:predicted phage terminase large subunit-like protein